MEFNEEKALRQVLRRVITTLQLDDDVEGPVVEALMETDGRATVIEGAYSTVIVLSLLGDLMEEELTPLPKAPLVVVTTSQPDDETAKLILQQEWSTEYPRYPTTEQVARFFRERVTGEIRTPDEPPTWAPAKGHPGPVQFSEMNGKIDWFDLNDIKGNRDHDAVWLFHDNVLWVFRHAGNNEWLAIAVKDPDMRCLELELRHIKFADLLTGALVAFDAIRSAD